MENIEIEDFELKVNRDEAEVLLTLFDIDGEPTNVVFDVPLLEDIIEVASSTLSDDSEEEE